MKTSVASGKKKVRRIKQGLGRPSVGIRELKTKASSIIADVKDQRVTYAVTKRGSVEALIVPVDAGERLVKQPDLDSAWEAWQTLVQQLSKESGKRIGSAVKELERMRR